MQGVGGEGEIAGLLSKLFYNPIYLERSEILPCGTTTDLSEGRGENICLPVLALNF